MGIFPLPASREHPETIHEAADAFPNTPSHPLLRIRYSAEKGIDPPSTSSLCY
jgi:hypothetical protein